MPSSLFRAAFFSIAYVLPSVLVVSAGDPPNGSSESQSRLEYDRLDHDLFLGLDNLLSCSDAKAMLNKVGRMEEIAQSFAERDSWRRKMLPFIRQDLEAIINMSDVDQRKTLDTIRSARYAIQDFKAGSLVEATKAIGVARLRYATILGEKSYYYAQCTDNELAGLILTRQADKALSLVNDLIALRLKMCGLNHPTTANAYELGARAEILTGQWKLAGEHAATAIAIRERLMGKLPARNLLIEQISIRVAIELGDLKKARESLNRFQEERAALIKDVTLVRSETFYLYVLLEEKAERYAEAQTAEEKGLKCLLEMLPRDDSRVKDSVQHLRTLLSKQKKWEELRSLEKEWGLMPLGKV
jgi:hypothetical protein